jgi:hypothetical protein
MANLIQVKGRIMRNNAHPSGHVFDVTTNNIETRMFNPYLHILSFKTLFLIVTIILLLQIMLLVYNICQK